MEVTAIVFPGTFICEYQGEVGTQQVEDLKRYGFALIFMNNGWIQMLAEYLPGIYTGKLACFKVFETMAQIMVMSTTSTIPEDQREYAHLSEAFELSLKDAINAMRERFNAGHPVVGWVHAVALAFLCWGKEVKYQLQTQSLTGKLVRLDVKEQTKKIAAHMWVGRTLITLHPMD